MLDIALLYVLVMLINPVLMQTGLKLKLNKYLKQVTNTFVTHSTVNPLAYLNIT